MSDFSRTAHDTETKTAAKFPFHKTYYHPVRAPQTDAVPTVFWPIVTLLLSVSVSLICWGAYNALPQIAASQEKHLRQAAVSPKFNPNSAGAPRDKGAESFSESEPDSRDVAVKVTGEPLLLPPAGAIQPVMLTAPPLPVQIAETNPLIYRESTSGDTPMLRNWKTLAFYSLLTSAVFGQAPVLADETTVLEKIKALQASINTSFEGVTKDMGELKVELLAQKGDLKKIGKDIDTMKVEVLTNRLLDMADANARFNRVESALHKIRMELDGMPNREPTIAKTGIDKGKGGVEEIKIKLESIEQALLRLQPSTNRIAMSPPVTSATGRVVLVNLYPEELLFVVNQKKYRVPPSENMPIDMVAAGPLSYEVISGMWGLRAKNTTTLAPNETFTLTAR